MYCCISSVAYTFYFLGQNSCNNWARYPSAELRMRGAVLPIHRNEGGNSEGQQQLNGGRWLPNDQIGAAILLKNQRDVLSKCMHELIVSSYQDISNHTTKKGKQASSITWGVGILLNNQMGLHDVRLNGCWHQWTVWIYSAFFLFVTCNSHVCSWDYYLALTSSFVLIVWGTGRITMFNWCASKMVKWGNNGGWA